MTHIPVLPTLLEYARSRRPYCEVCGRMHNSDEKCRHDGMLKLVIPSVEMIEEEYSGLLRKVFDSTSPKVP